MSRHLAMTIALLSACGGPPPVEHVRTGDTTVEVVREAPRQRQSPPESGPARDVRFPAITRAQTTHGLELDTVRSDNLPVVYLRLVVRSGSATDPADLPGVAHLTAQMLKEGTRSRTSAQLAEAVEFLGADLDVGSDSENAYISLRVLSEHLDAALDILADVALRPRFDDQELGRLRRRELDRLALSANQPRYLARKFFYAGLYGSHPYARVDTTPEAVQRITRQQLVDWHRTHFVPNNAFLVAVGDVDAERVRAGAERAFRGWRSRAVPETAYTAPPQRTAREVVVVDRPESVQSVIYVGNLALARNSPDYVPLMVANQVLGGSAASRLFMDLREQRSLTYGAYSSVNDAAQVAPFIAFAAVRNEVTAEAMGAFMEHLDRIVAEAPPEDELANAQSYLSDSFPLQIETPARIAYMVEEQRVYGLPDDYWDTFRTAIRSVASDQAFGAARTYIHPDRALIVAVGRASAVVEPLRRFGPVRVVDMQGREVQRLEASAD
ncbi:MAG: insulinase family protein [Sandaracinaceae bacterium]|nr:insulinase family protein [Sandaracinaceae bacterium]